ncbi:MAG: ribosome-associated translation inhibitor RaiA [Candidatus Jorgensenbacteria bacterium]|nr:ribosome-associated translation inhibitor RaiA [Candidatus Jorgensenbacteria bacterium]
MRLNILATGMELTPAIRTYVEEKFMMLERILRHYETSGEATIHVEISHTTKHHRHGNVFYAEANLKLPGEVLRVENNNTDLYSAIDKIKDTLKNDIIKYKNKSESKVVRRTLREK